MYALLAIANIRNLNYMYIVVIVYRINILELLFIYSDQTSIQERGITCVTSSLTSPMEGTITILIDQSTVTNISVHFNYMTNPTFINVIPSTTIIA